MPRGRMVATVVLCAAVAAGAQPLPRIETGDASVSGVVIDRRTKQPIEGAIVELAMSRLNAGRLLTQTDPRGHFAFDHVAPGQYRVIVKHPGYVMQSYGTSDPSIFGMMSADGIVTLDRGQRRSDINFALVAGGSVSGRVTSADGRPLENAHVRATLRRDDGSFLFVENAIGQTNRRGEYALSDLPAGVYDISAAWGDPTTPAGRVGQRAPAFGPQSSTVYHPGASRPQDGQPVKVEPAAALKNIHIRFPPSELIRIAGQVVRSGSEGEVEAVLLTGMSEQGVTVGADGRFTTPRLPSGRYTLFARSRTDDLLEAAWMSVDLTFDMTDIVLALLPTGSIAGRVTTADGNPIPDMLQIAAVLTDEGNELDPNRRDRAFLEPDGSFEIRGLFGPRVMRAVGVTEGWAIDRVTVEKAPVTSFTMEPGTKIDNVIVVLKQRQ